MISDHERGISTIGNNASTGGVRQELCASEKLERKARAMIYAHQVPSKTQPHFIAIISVTLHLGIAYFINV